VNDGIFNELLDSKAFFGTLTIFGHHYGLPRFNPELPTVLLLRAPAVKEIRTHFPTARVIEIEASLFVLKKRLLARGSTDRIDPEQLEKEMKLGQLLAEKIIDSSNKTVDEIASFIAESVQNGSL
jgi:ribose 1,5-bisphosphokinase PhnN